MSGGQELWQAYDEQGLPITGGSLTKAQAAAGALHGAAHIWLWRRSDRGVVEVLLQEREKNKSTWPGCLDISAAGHIDYGETSLAAALRETKEELGLELSETDLTLLFVHRERLVAPPAGKIENEFQMVYSAQLPAGQEIELSDDEVSSTRWMPLALYAQALAGETEDLLVPHGAAYGASLQEQIEALAAQE
jgi:isopentenyldiphosphate isomerase